MATDKWKNTMRKNTEKKETKKSDRMNKKNFCVETANHYIQFRQTHYEWKPLMPH